MTAIPLDISHDPGRTSWVSSAQGHPDFPIQNLPLGVFSRKGETPRAGVAIGDAILDLEAARGAGLLAGEPAIFAEAAAGGSLNRALALGAGPRRALRLRLGEILASGSPEQGRAQDCLRDAAACALHLPAAIGDYTDFYVGIHHATQVGRQLRPDAPLLPNYKYVPIGYHGRASSVRPSGEPVRRPRGQRKPPDAAEPVFGPSRRLDYELELGIWVGPGNDLGSPIAIADADRHVAGFCLLNDWSARDIQAWEYQPLGPFLAKSFGTTVSPWIITPEALAPFRTAQPPRPAGDPPPLPYLLDGDDQGHGALDLSLGAFLLTPGMRARGMEPFPVARSNARHMYWTAAQIVTHHASNGCNLRAGDLIGTGTLSGPDRSGAGSLLEATRGGRDPIVLPTGEQRGFLEDGDIVILQARAERAGFVPIGFGACRAEVLPAPVS